MTTRSLSVLVVLVGSTFACKGEEQKPTGLNEHDRAVVEGQVRARDCERLRNSIDAAQKRIAEKAASAYSKKAFEELATLREAAAKEASELQLGTEAAKAIADAWRSVNVRAASAERRVAVSLGDAGADSGSGAGNPASELMEIAGAESKALADFAKLCP